MPTTRNWRPATVIVWPIPTPSFVSATTSPERSGLRPLVACGLMPCTTVPNTTTSTGVEPPSVTRVSTIGLAFVTPGMRATRVVTDDGNATLVVNGPGTPLGTTPTSASNDATVRLISLLNPEFMPASRSVIPNTRPVATTAITNRRRRHCRSRRLISSMAP